MSPARRTRGYHLATRLFHLLLLVLMLAFGLHARLSQYLPEAALHPAPLALYDQDAQNSKLLCSSVSSELRRPTALALVGVERPPQLPGRTLPSRRDRQLGKSVPSAILFYPSPLFFRPPPSSLLA